ncbi:MAG: AVAST type 3 anti-phage protein Avs3b [Bacillota bacterium]
MTKELGLDQSVDTLGRWMAHYIAELIQNAETASAEKRPVKMRDCCEAILNLWKHRNTLPNGKRPFEELEPLQRTLESLDPEDDTPRYFRSVRAFAEDADENDETKSWLKLIDGLDYSAKILIRYCLTQAAQNALNKSLEWVGLAEAAGTDEGIEFSLIRVIAEEDELLNASDPSEEERKRIQERIERLEGFAKMAMAVVTDLRQEFQQNKGARDEA